MYVLISCTVHYYFLYIFYLKYPLHVTIIMFSYVAI